MMLVVSGASAFGVDHPKTRLLEQLADVLRTKRYSPRTIEAYSGSVRRYVRFHSLKHPRELDAAHVRSFLTPVVLAIMASLRSLLALGRTVDGAFVLLHRSDGSVLPVVMNAVQRPDEHTIEFAMLVVREREQYEATLRKAQVDAEQALHAMAASVALTTPGSSSILDDLGRATAAADRMEGIVRQLLAFTGRQLVTHALMPETASRTHLARDLWPVSAASDQMEQLFISLVLNARDALTASGRTGQITIASGQCKGTSTSAVHPTSGPP